MTSNPDMPAALAPSLPSVPTAPVLEGTCDTHVHVFDPARYPYADARSYTPPSATAAQLVTVMARLGAERVVVVQPSCYGTDNAAMLDAVSQLGLDRARGVAVLDGASLQDRGPDIEALHRAGVRGVRLNGSVNELGDGHAIAAQMRRLHAATAHLGWHVQMYMPASTVREIAPAIAALKMTVVLDHFGGLDASSCAEGSPEVDTLLQLLKNGNVYLKLSAPYRVEHGEDHRQDVGKVRQYGVSRARQPGVGQALGDVVRQFAQAAPDRLLWGSDWPHTGGLGRRTGAGPSTGTGTATTTTATATIAAAANTSAANTSARIEPFRSEDAASALDDLQTWLPDPALRHRILVSNPARLYGFDQRPPPYPLERSE